jgi:hypothetical protein
MMGGVFASFELLYRQEINSNLYPAFFKKARNIVIRKFYPTMISNLEPMVPTTKTAKKKTTNSISTSTIISNPEFTNEFDEMSLTDGFGVNSSTASTISKPEARSISSQDIEAQPSDLSTQNHNFPDGGTVAWLQCLGLFSVSIATWYDEPSDLYVLQEVC